MNESDFSHNLEDFNLSSQIYHDVERKAITILRDRYKKEKGLTEEQLNDEMTFREFADPKDFFIEVFSFEEVDAIYREIEQQLREDYISIMKFEQQYKDQRHIGDLKYAQRETDASYAVGMQQNMKGVSDSGKSITTDISEIDIKKIFDSYINLAEQYNVQDTEQFRAIIESTIRNPKQGILINEFSSLITDESAKESFTSLFKDSKNKLETFDKALSIAQQDANSRIDTIKDKTSILEYFAKMFPEIMSNYHTSTINELDTAIERTKKGIDQPESITINPKDAVKNALKVGITTTDILNVKNQQAKDERDEREQTHE